MSKQHVSFVASLSLNNVVLTSAVRLRETLLLILRDHLWWVSCGRDVVWFFYDFFFFLKWRPISLHLLKGKHFLKKAVWFSSPP